MQNNRDEVVWNCFDIAINVSRERLVDFALQHSSDLLFRSLLSSEICYVALTTIKKKYLLNEITLKKQELNKAKNDLKEQNILEQEIIVLQNRIDAVSLFSLPEIMFNPSLIRLAIVYSKASIGMCNLIIESNQYLKQHQINTVLSVSDISTLPEILAKSTCTKAPELLNKYKTKQEKLSLAIKNFSSYCQTEEIYKQYIQEYYAKEGKVVFYSQLDFLETTSMIDIAAKMCGKHIVLFQKMPRGPLQEAYRTNHKECENEIILVFDGLNHFVSYHAYLISRMSLLPTPIREYVQPVWSRIFPPTQTYAKSTYETLQACGWLGRYLYYAYQIGSIATPGTFIKCALIKPFVVPVINKFGSKSLTNAIDQTTELAALYFDMPGWIITRGTPIFFANGAGLIVKYGHIDHPEVIDLIKYSSIAVGTFVGQKSDAEFKSSKIGEAFYHDYNKYGVQKLNKMVQSMVPSFVQTWSNYAITTVSDAYDFAISRLCKSINMDPTVPLFVSKAAHAENQKIEAHIFSSEERKEQNKALQKDIQENQLPQTNSAIDSGQKNIEQLTKDITSLTKINPSELAKLAGTGTQFEVACAIANAMIPNKEGHEDAWKAVYNTMMIAQNGSHHEKHLRERITEQRTAHLESFNQQLHDADQQQNALINLGEKLKEQNRSLSAEIEADEIRIAQEKAEYMKKLTSYQQNQFNSLQSEKRAQRKKVQQFNEALQNAKGIPVDLHIDISTLLANLEANNDLKGVLFENEDGLVIRDGAIRLAESNVGDNSIQVIIPVLFQTKKYIESSRGEGDIIFMLSVNCKDGKFGYDLQSTFDIRKKQKYFGITFGFASGDLDQTIKSALQTKLEDEIKPELNKWIHNTNIALPSLINNIKLDDGLTISLNKFDLTGNSVSLTSSALSLQVTVKADFSISLSYQKLVEMINIEIPATTIDFGNIGQLNEIKAISVDPVDNGLSVHFYLNAQFAGKDISGNYILNGLPVYDPTTQKMLFAIQNLESKTYADGLSLPLLLVEGLLECLAKQLGKTMEVNIGDLINQNLNNTIQGNSATLNYQINQLNHTYLSGISFSSQSLQMNISLRSSISNLCQKNSSDVPTSPLISSADSTLSYESFFPVNPAKRRVDTNDTNGPLRKKFKTSLGVTAESMTSWYGENKIKALLGHYFDNNSVKIFTPINADQNNGETLENNLYEDQLQDALGLSLEQSLSKTLIIPINLGWDNDLTYKDVAGQHWTILIIQFTTNRLKPIIHYFDSFGSDIPQLIREKLYLVYTDLVEDDIIISKTQLQHNTYDCGPWIIEFAKSTVLNSELLHDITLARYLHQSILMSTTFSERPSSDIQKLFDHNKPCESNKKPKTSRRSADTQMLNEGKKFLNNRKRKNPEPTSPSSFFRNRTNETSLKRVKHSQEEAPTSLPESKLS
jgi:hypothetical protein